MTYQKERPSTIQEMFASIAHNYDKANSVLSFRMHKLWNRELINYVKSSNPRRLLDLCCGTGEIGLTYLKQAPQTCHVSFVDFCPEMLTHAEKKSHRLNINPLHQLSFIPGDAHSLPFADREIDYTTIAYGIRNVKDPRICLREVFRVLEAGGSLGILELTEPTNPFLRIGHQLYLKTMLPLLGPAYKYLSTSIHHFMKPTDLETMLQEVGFSEIQRKTLCGGIATIFVAKKIISLYRDEKRGNHGTH